MTVHRIVVDQATAAALLLDRHEAFAMSAEGYTVPNRPTHVTSPVPVAKGDEVVLVVSYLQGSAGFPHVERRERVVARARAAGDAHPLTPPGPDRLYRVPLCDAQEAKV